MLLVLAWPSPGRGTHLCSESESVSLSNKNTVKKKKRKKKNWCIYFFERQGKKNLPFPGSLPKCLNLARLKPGDWNSIWASHVGGRAICSWTTIWTSTKSPKGTEEVQVFKVTFCWLLGSITTKLDQKQKCWDSNWHRHMSHAFQVAARSTEPQGTHRDGC